MEYQFKPEQNIIYLSKGTFERKRKKWQKENKETKIEVNHFVKLNFTDGNMAEHMWVKVSRSDNKLIGYLDNTPKQLKNYKFGDRIQFQFEEIADYT